MKLDSLPYNIFSEPEVISESNDPGASYLSAPPASFKPLGKLGGNSEISWGAGLATTLGVNILPKFTKTANAGANYNFSRNTSKGVRTIVDLNGDGLPDRLTSVHESVYFESLSYNEVENAYNFESPVVINGLKIFSKEVSNNNSFGGEAHFGHTLSGDHSIGNNKTKVYFTDINADGLIDVVNNGYVYYNKLDANGDPSFEVIAPEDMDEQSFAGEICVDAGMGSDGDSFDGIPIIANELDSEILYKEGDTVWTRHCTDKETFTSQDPDNWRSFYDSIIATYPHEITNDKFCWYTYELIPGELKIYPPHDLVKLWIAPYDGDITISNDAVLTENLMSKRDFSDSLKISIQIDTIVYDKILTKTDATTSIPTDIVFSVKRGDHIYFRVESMDKKRYDKVAWTPQINYIKYGNNTLSSIQQNSLDANGKHIYKFNASEDFLINPNTKYAMPFDGRIKADTKIKISEDLSDNVYFVVKRNGAYITPPPFLNIAMRDSVETTLTIEEAYVSQGDTIEFRVECFSNVNWEAISWEISLYYDNIEPIDNLTIAAYDTSFNPPKPNVKFDIIPFFTTYPKPVRPSIFVEQLTNLTNYYDTVYIDTLKIINSNSPISNFLGFLSIKGDDGSVQNRLINYSQNIYNGIYPIDSIQIIKNVGYFIDFYTADTIELNNLKICFDNNSNCFPYSIGIHCQHRSEDLKFGNLYRNWGQFNYKNTSTAYTDLIVKDSLCQSIGLQTALATSNALAETDPEQANEIITNWFETHPYEQEKFLPMSPDYKYNQWVGYGNVSYVNADTLSNTLPCVLGIMPEAEYSLEAMGMPGEDEDDILDDLPPGAVKQAPILKSKSENTTANLSAFGIVGSGNSWTEITTTTSFQDMNGDRYPDEITERLVKYSNPQGGTSDFVKAHNSFDYGNEFKKGAGTLYNFGASVPSPSQIRSFCSGKKTETQGSIGSFGYGSSDMNTKSILSFIDYNGDGLPDKITDEGKVLYNLGYEFYAPIVISNLFAKNDYSNNSGGSLGVNIVGNSIAAGYGTNTSTNNTNLDIIDINGDGLPDKLTSVTFGLKCEFNTGKSFISTDIYDIYTSFKTISKNNNLNVAVTFNLFCFAVNPKTFMSWGASDVKGMFSDINADGLVDYVYEENNQIKVRYNQLGKTNLLKIVTNLVGSEFKISYSLSKHGGFDCPNRTMIMDSLKIFDGYTEDGANYQYFAFEYDSCMYQRFDRENLGFKIVKTKALDQELEAYKIITEHYHNDKVLLKGLKYKDLITDKDGNKYIENEYIYGLCALNNGQYISSSDECRCDAFPALSEQVRKYYETQTEPQIITNESFEYGQYGNITKYTQEGDITDNDDNFTATITYMGYSPQYLVGKQTSVVIKVSGEQTIRKTDYLHNDTTGNLTKITKYNNDITSEFDYAYDVYGNITRVLLPHNATNQRMRYNYIYDNQIFSLPTQVTSVLGYSSNTTYDYKLQVPLSNTDINNNTISFEHDWRGRLTKVVSPNETDFTIKYEYSLGNTDTDIAWAKTMHYDVFNEDSTINTILFCDGLGKIIQTKKTMEINGQEKRVVSGKIIYDDYARKIAEYYPKEEAITANDISINTENEDNTAPTQYQYDILNRITKTTYPDGTADSIVYDISENKFRTKHIDAMGNIVTSYFDYRNLPTKITNSVGSTILEYDQLGQKLSTTDPDNIQTSYTYDMLGRKTSRTHPDAGLHSYSYDQASNLISIDKNGLQTNYTYEYNRLKEVEYSEFQENKITYTYGNANAASNQKGRIVAIEDINGWVHFEYDKLGNVSKETKIVVLPNEAGIFQFSMLFDYDSWARVKSMQYPDGEIVYYSYDRGGNLKKLSGSKIFTSSSENYPYIKDILYNKFGKRSNIIYGNDIESTYQYDNMLRLSNLQSSSNDETLQILNYQYDYVGNIVAINNTASALANGTGIGGEYSNTYEYDNIYRLTNASNSHSGNGINKTKTTQMQYSPNGRILEKKHITTNNNANPPFLLPSTTGFNNYEYNNNKVLENDNFSFNFALDRVYNNYEYDANGNMTKTTKYSLPLMQPSFPAILSSRNLYWNDSDQLQAMTDYSNSAHYFYNYAGDRTWKVVGAKITTTLSGIQRTYNVFNQSTYYLFPQVTITNSAYTKHIFAGTERICSKIGTGKSVDMLQLLLPPTAQITAKRSQQTNLMKRTFSNLCISNLNPPPIFLCAIVNGGNILSINLLSSSAAKITSTATEYEDLQYFYLSDHLGSSSWISDKDGNALQHLSYLPFGEVFANQKAQNSSFDTEYKFSGKERDTETGFDYFGARYYVSELGIWLSVDPMAEERSWITPYNYSQNNPVGRSDKSGMLDDEYQFDKLGNFVNRVSNDKIDKLTIIGDKKNVSSIDFKVGTFEGKINTVVNGDTFFEGLSGKTSESVFNFMSDNSSAEWGYMETINEDRSSSFLVGTGHNDLGETAVFPKAMSATEGSVIKYDHSHPNYNFFSNENCGYPSNSKTSLRGERYSDVDAWEMLKKRNPNISVGIRHAGRNRNFYQNKNGNWKEIFNNN